MKKLLLLASFALFSFNHTTASVGINDIPSDTTQTKNKTRKVELKINDTSTPQKAKPTKAEAKDATPQKLKQTGGNDAIETKAKRTTEARPSVSTPDKPTSNIAKSASIDELKAASKKSYKIKRSEEVKKTKAVSYPYYTGGNVAIREFIRKHQRYPEECKSERLRGRVEVTMIIDWDGTPHSPRITKSSGNEHMDAEALRVADMMPGWNPAEESDDPQGIEYTIFVNFRPGR